MNILLTSVGRRAYMVNYFKDVVNGKVHAVNSEFTYAMEIADESAISPLIYDHGYIDFILSYCEKHVISVVLSLFDVDLLVLSRNKVRFQKKNIKLIVSDESFISVCSDKYKTYNWLKAIGIKTPNTYLDIYGCLMDIKREKCTYPVIVKPRWGMGSIGVYEASDQIELEVFYDKVRKDIAKSYLKYESEADIEQSVIIQEKLKGEEYGIDVFNNLKGEYLSCVPKRKLAMRSGETDAAVIIEDKKLVELGRKISLHSKHVANLDVDCFIVNKEYYVLEMNARFGGQYPFSHLSGVNYPKVIIDIVNNCSVSDDCLMPLCNVKGFKNIQPVILND